MSRILVSHPEVVVFLTAWFASDIITWVVKELAVRYHWLDSPGSSGHKQHANATPTLGGLAMCAGFLIALGLVVHPDRVLTIVLLTALAIVIVGTCDDLFGVSAVIKLGVLGIATAILTLNGISLHLTGIPIVDGFITFLWIGFVSSAFNGLDNSDGAAAGVCMIVGMTVAAVAWASWQQDLARLALALAAACLGFLRHNFNPAKIFMGDSGSFFLGYIVATILVLGRWSSSASVSCLIPIVILAVPMFDFLLILITRGLDGKYKRWVDPIVMCGRDHTAHRLMNMGLSVREAVLFFYAVSILAGGVALWMFNVSATRACVGFAAFASSLLLAAAALRVHEFRDRLRALPEPPTVAADTMLPAINEAVSA